MVGLGGVKDNVSGRITVPKNRGPTVFAGRFQGRGGESDARMQHRDHREPREHPDKVGQAPSTENAESTLTGSPRGSGQAGQAPSTECMEKKKKSEFIPAGWDGVRRRRRRGIR